ncbi:MAG: tetratricopeptide repeat protein [Acidobacteria bacterium]|nr:tetratricopeptide repeat protein [Acidobacteriota bacterium]
MNPLRLAVLTGLAIVVLAFALYSSALDNDFVWDDPIVFKQQLPYFDSFSNVFFPPASIPQFGGVYYRPMIVMTYQLDEKLAATFWPEAERERARRIVYHASCVVYHVLATGLLYLLVLALAEGAGLTLLEATAAAAAAGVLFAAHPIHVESVGWMAGRSDVVCSVFFLAAALLYVVHRRSGSVPALVGALAAAFGAMLSKEMGVTVVVVPLVVDLLLRIERRRPEQVATRAERRRQARVAAAPRAESNLPWSLRVAPFFVAFAFYYGLRRVAIRGMGNESTVLADADPAAILSRLLGSVGWYVVKAFWPPPQSAFVGDIPSGFVYLALGLLAPLATLAFVAWAWKRRDWAPAAFGLLLFFLAIAPSLAVAAYRISETPLAERYLYLPTAGLGLALGYALVRGARRIAGTPLSPRAAAGATAVAIAIAIPASFATVQRNTVWQNDLNFWLDTAAKAPDKGIPHLHLGIAYAELNQDDKAMVEYQRALETYDDSEGRSKAHNNLGTTYLRLKQFDKAIEHFQKALLEDTRYSTAHYNWALAELSLAQKVRQDPEQYRAHKVAALQHLETALEINPRYYKAHLRFGFELLQAGRLDLGMAHLQQVVQLAPASPEAAEARKMMAAAPAAAPAP